MILMRRRLFKPALFHSKKFLSNYTGDRVLEPLNNRSLLKLRGNDTVSLLQGLVTNDVNILVNNGVGSLYALFLNLKGRVLFDTIIHKLPESDTYLLEVDKAASSSIQKHILLHRVRKDVKIENIDKDYKIWAQFDPSLLSIDPRYDDINLRKKDELSDTAIVLETNDGNVMEFFDPRTSLLGSRIIAHKTASKFVYFNFGNESEQSLYKMYRYRLGIAEGIHELPSGKCIPLEANCDYLNGVSFDKGCYLGQELTARSYHTGVIRKRYMPIFFHEDNGDEIQDENITAFDKKVGVLRGRKNNVGIALLRIAQVENKTLIADGMKAFTSKPFWWSQKQITLNQELSDKPKESFVTAPKSIY